MFSYIPSRYFPKPRNQGKVSRERGLMRRDFAVPGGTLVTALRIAEITHLPSFIRETLANSLPME